MIADRSGLVVKVQLPLFSSGENPPALVYNEDRTVECYCPVTPDLVRAMEGQKRAFFRASICDGVLELSAPLEEQGW